MQSTIQEVARCVAEQDIPALDRIRVIARDDADKLRGLAESMIESHRSDDPHRCVVENLADAAMHISAACVIASEVLLK